MALILSSTVGRPLTAAEVDSNNQYLQSLATAPSAAASISAQQASVSAAQAASSATVASSSAQTAANNAASNAISEIEQILSQSPVDAAVAASNAAEAASSAQQAAVSATSAANNAQQAASSAVVAANNATAAATNLDPTNQQVPTSFDGSEIWSIKKAGLWFQARFQNIADWSLGVYKAFLQVGSGASSRTILSKIGDSPITPQDFGAKGDGVSDDTVAIQTAIDYLDSIGGGVLYMPPGVYLVSGSRSSETFSNFGASVPANTGCIILRNGVSIIGAGRNICTIKCNNPTITMIYHITPLNSMVQGMTISNAWTNSAPNSGVGHGIFTLASSGGALYRCKNVTYRDLIIQNVGSYGIGIQNGYPINCRIEDVIVDTNGADGLDLKARDANDPSAINSQPYGNSANNIVINNHGGRITGSCGIDTRGVWSLTNVQVVNFGGFNQSIEYLGVRFRTKDTLGTGYVGIANYSTLDNFFISPVAGSTATIEGVESGSDCCSISNGTVLGGNMGVAIIGNSVGSATRTTVTSVRCIGASQYGFYVTVNCTDTMFIGCMSSASGVYGFYNTGTRTSFISCSGNDTTPLYTSSSGLPTQIIQGSNLSSDGSMSVNSSISGRLDITPVGLSPNIDINFSPKGTGYIRLNSTFNSSPDVACNGWFYIKDSSGALRKVMTTS